VPIVKIARRTFGIITVTRAGLDDAVTLPPCLLLTMLSEQRRALREMDADERRAADRTR